MIKEICQSCGNVLKGDRPDFCDQCGCDLRQSSQQQSSSASGEQAEPVKAVQCQKLEPPVEQDVPSASNEEKEVVYLEMLTEAWADSKLTIEEVQELGKLRLQLGISEARASELGQKAIESLRLVQQDDFDEEPLEDVTHGLELLVNVNQFYMETYSGVIDVKIKNHGKIKFDAVEIKVSADMLEKSENFRCLLDCGKEVRKRFEGIPSNPGINLIRFTIVVRQNKDIYAFWAEEDFPVFRETKDLQQISIQADTFIDNSVGDNSKVMGNAVKNQIDSLVSIGKIKNTNDLMSEYRKLRPDYKILQLIYDPDVGKYSDGTEPDSIRGVTGFDEQRSWGLHILSRASKLSHVWKYPHGIHVDNSEKIQGYLAGIDSTLCLLNNGGDLLAIEANSGERRWRKKIDEVGVVLTVAPVAAMGFVFAAASDGTISCFDVESGEIKGQYSVPGICGQLSVLNDSLYVGTDDKRLLKLGIPSLKLLAGWPLEDKLMERVLGGQCDSCSCIFAPCEHSLRLLVKSQGKFTRILSINLTAKPSAVNGIVCTSSVVLEESNRRGILHFFRPTIPSVPCRYQAAGLCYLDSPVVGAPVFIDSSICVSCSNSDIILFDINSSEKQISIERRWKMNLGLGFRPAHGMAYSGQKLFVCGSDSNSGFLYCLDISNGKLIGERVKCETGVHVAPLVIDHMVYVATNNGKIHAYRVT